MSAKDISRFIFQPTKRYSSVRMQQGRVILDSDWNESERIDDEDPVRLKKDTVKHRASCIRVITRRVRVGREHGGVVVG